MKKYAIEYQSINGKRRTAAYPEKMTLEYMLGISPYLFPQGKIVEIEALPELKPIKAVVNRLKGLK